MGFIMADRTPIVTGKDADRMKRWSNCDANEGRPELFASVLAKCVIGTIEHVIGDDA
jgi:hypothetical protein